MLSVHIAQVRRAQIFIKNTFGYEIQKLALLYEAIDTSGLTGRQSNKRLALFGDGALDIAVKAAWYPSGQSTSMTRPSIA